MINVDLKGCKSFITDLQLNGYISKAEQALDILNSGTGAGNDFLGWNKLPSEMPHTLIDECLETVDKWIAKEIEIVVVIGIGGSYLGAKAAIESLNHQFQHLMGISRGPQIVFAGQNLSEEYMAELMDLLSFKNVAAVVISKSGTTTEPAVAFRLIKSLIEEKYGEKEACERIVAITDAHRGALKSLSDEKGYKTFVIEDNVGGRFSVLTPVGLLPIALAGFDIEALLEGTKAMEQICDDNSANNPAIKYAAMRNALYDAGKKIELLVGFNPKLQYVGEWWKQLYGESEGKQGKGIFPAAVNFTTDLHSMGQYIQDGERTLFETVISIQNSRRDVLINNDPLNLDGLNFLSGKHIEHCNKMAQLGTKLAHISGGVPNIEISIDQIDEYYLGQLFYFFEKACGISAYILGVNPFDQPGVEAYKKNMFALLDKPGYETLSEALKKQL
ncbi:MAG: glucose-6-phosphate isomerase [Bacteroidales bacterium]|nr:glucose-6-phosphate isomerase [Bacteroidales bacterium]MDD4670120.1 glucose-6-phosphate isomerase [Bacteroidales bacterium]